MKQLLFEGTNFRLVREHFDAATAGVDKTIEYVEQPEVVIAVPVLEDQRILLVEHIRPILQTTLLECPGGKVDPGEDLETCLVRELQEEVGYTPGRIEYQDYFYTSVGSSTEKIHIFQVGMLRLHPRKPDDIKRMRIRAMQVEEVWDLLRSNQIHDGKTEIALYKYLSRRDPPFFRSAVTGGPTSKNDLG